MPQSRRTRQQKIQLTQRKGNNLLPVDGQEIESRQDVHAGGTSHKANAREAIETERYVIDELKRIAWISLLCVVILLLATILLADFEWAKSVRGVLSL